MEDSTEVTRRFTAKEDATNEISLILKEVCEALREKGDDPLDQIVGYLLSGDPTYITRHRNARVLIRKVDRDRILEELVRTFLDKQGIE